MMLSVASKLLENLSTVMYIILIMNTIILRLRKLLKEERICSLLNRKRGNLRSFKRKNTSLTEER